MKKNLVIVESPAKAKTIEKILGKEFRVKASLGHIRDLKSSGYKEIGIDIENSYAPKYSLIRGKKKILDELKEAVKKSEMVYLAPDPDREGEAIAWHIKEALKLPDEKTKRILYSSVTKRAITEAVNNPHEIDMNLVNAQQGRRILDRLVGFNLSPFLWKKITKNLSAGRVQSVALRIVVNREKEIEAFVPEEFWRITASLLTEGGDSLEAGLKHWQGKKFELGNPAAQSEAAVQKVLEHLKTRDYRVQKTEGKEVSGRNTAPFITSSLQQAANTHLRFSPSRTMRIAQKLYEGVAINGEPVGLITYMRTDSTRIEPEALNEVRGYIARRFDKEYLPEKPILYSAKKGAQDAHESIRPTSVERTPEQIASFLNKDEQALYRLIWCQFTASQMKPPRYKTTVVSIQAGDGVFETRGRVLLFPGYNKILAWRKEESETELPEMNAGEILSVKALEPRQNFTTPPPRYSEASLIKALEKAGIGRPSTYAPTMRTLKERGYVLLRKQYLRASELGTVVSDMLSRNFTDIMDPDFTAQMEEKLDQIEKGDLSWVEVIDQFYRPFMSKLDEATQKTEALKGRPYEGEEKCPVCQSDLVIRYSKAGAFLGCSRYPDCRGLLPFPKEQDPDAEEREPSSADCPSCGKPMILKESRYKKSFYACTGYPECKTTLSADKDGKPVPLPEIKQDCDRCGKPMIVKSGARGPFLLCEAPDCGRMLSLSPEGKVMIPPTLKEEISCEKCQSPMQVKYSRRGYFLACTGFPKCRNAKNLTDEMVTEPLPPKPQASGKTKSRKTASPKTASSKAAAKSEGAEQ